MYLIILPFQLFIIVGQTGLFSIGMATSLEEEGKTIVLHSVWVVMCVCVCVLGNKYTPCA